MFYAVDLSPTGNFSIGDPCQPSRSTNRRNSVQPDGSAWICRTGERERLKTLPSEIHQMNEVRFFLRSSTVFSAGKSGVCCGEDRGAADGERAAPQRRRPCGHRTGGGAG